MHEEIDILIDANVDALESLLQARKAAFAPEVLWSALTLRKIESAGQSLELARNLIEALSVPSQDLN